MLVCISYLCIVCLVHNLYWSISQVRCFLIAVTKVKSAVIITKNST